MAEGLAVNAIAGARCASSGSPSSTSSFVSAEAMDAGDLHCLAHQHSIKPAAAAATARVGAILVRPGLPQVLTRGIRQLDRKGLGPGAHAPVAVLALAILPRTDNPPDGPTPAPDAAVAATVLLEVT